MVGGWTDDGWMTNIIYTIIGLNFSQLLARKEFYYKGNLQWLLKVVSWFVFIAAIVILIIAAHICSKHPWSTIWGKGSSQSEEEVPLLVYKMISGDAWCLVLNYNESHTEKVTPFPRFFQSEYIKEQVFFGAKHF